MVVVVKVKVVLVQTSFGYQKIFSSISLGQWGEAEHRGHAGGYPGHPGGRGQPQVHPPEPYRAEGRGENVLKFFCKLSNF